MANPNTWMNLYCAQINNFCNLIQDLRLMNDQLAADPSIVTKYFAETSPPPRSDIVAADVTNAESAITQMLFTFDSGTPTQKSYLFKVIP